VNIVFLVYDIHFGGGAERVTVNLANYLAVDNNKVTIVSLSRFNPSNIFTINDKVTVDYLNFNFESFFNPLYKVASVFKVNSYFMHYPNPTILVGIGTYPSLILAMMPKMKNLKTIGCQHNSFAFAKHIWSFLRKLSFHRLSAVVSLTEHDLPKLRTLNLNSYVIPNAVSFFPDVQAKLDNNILLAIGRMDYNKGYDLLLDIFEKLTLAFPDWKLRIIGDGPLKKKIISRIETSGLNDRVEILSPTNQIIDQYLQASVYLMTSRTEALPMVLLEAKACGLPVVSFNCETGPSDIINNGKDGYLIDCFNVDQMTEKVSILCSDPELRRQFGTNGRESIKKFLPEVIAQKWESLFRQIIQ